MDNNILTDKNFAMVKLERAKRMTMIFDQLDEKEIRTLLSEISQAMQRLGILNEDYYIINKILNMNIRIYGGIAKAISWKEGQIIKKYDILNIINRTERIIGYT